MRTCNTRKRILVTGDVNLLGSYLCDGRLKQGHKVLCLGNFFAGTRRHIAHLHGHPQNICPDTQTLDVVMAVQIKNSLPDVALQT